MTTRPAAALPKPDWSRPGETWRITPETAVLWTTETHGVPCSKCRRPSVAGIVRYNELRNQWCDKCLAGVNMWVEDDRVVSWMLSK